MTYMTRRRWWLSDNRSGPAFAETDILVLLSLLLLQFATGKQIVSRVRDGRTETNIDTTPSGVDRTCAGMRHRYGWFSNRFFRPKTYTILHSVLQSTGGSRYWFAFHHSISNGKLRIVRPKKHSSTPRNPNPSTRIIVY